MPPGEKLLALTLEYRDAIENPATIRSVGLECDGRSPAEIGAGYEAALRQLIS